MPNDGFGGDYLRPATRAETAYLLAQALEDNDAVVLNDVTAVIDVSTDSPYYDAILTLYRSGLAVGTDASGQFHPDSLLTRATCTAHPKHSVRGSRDFAGRLFAAGQ